jgi:hypothetical protein
MVALRRFFAGAVMGASMLTTLAATPASATPVPQPDAEAVSCPLEPGVYAITNSKGQLVGALIVYPDCSTEILPAT